MNVLFRSNAVEEGGTILYVQCSTRSTKKKNIKNNNEIKEITFHQIFIAGPGTALFSGGIVIVIVTLITAVILPVPWEERGELVSSVRHDEMTLPLSFSPKNPRGSSTSASPEPQIDRHSGEK